jgi:hypothetical protein
LTAPVTNRSLYLHIGAGKTGTSALQAGLRASVDLLLDGGIGFPLVERREYSRRLLRPMGWMIGAGFVDEPDAGAIRKLVRTMRNAPGDRLLLSNEDLCELDPPRIQLLMEVARDADLDVEVVLTARNWSKQLPSEYQQFLKHRLTLDYPTFLENVRDREGAASEHFWLRQDFAGTCRRWGAQLDPGKVHVIAVPPMAQDPEGVFRLFGDAIGFDTTNLRKPQDAVNPSFGYTEAEVLRRVNVALGKRLPDYETDYVPVVRNVLIRKVLAREKSARLTIPPEHISWVRELDQQRVAELQEAGYQLHGDAEQLVAPLEAARSLPVLDEADVAAAAIETLARFAVNMSNRSKRARSSTGREGS